MKILKFVMDRKAFQAKSNESLSLSSSIQTVQNLWWRRRQINDICLGK